MQKPKITYFPNGQKQREQWWINNRYHRTNGPALTWWYANGQKESEQWYINGELHRTNGPALTWWYENGQKQREQREQWWINGTEVTSEILSWFEQEGIDPKNITKEDEFKIIMRWV